MMKYLTLPCIIALLPALAPGAVRVDTVGTTRLDAQTYGPVWQRVYSLPGDAELVPVGALSAQGADRVAVRTCTGAVSRWLESSTMRCSSVLDRIIFAECSPKRFSVSGLVQL